MSAGEATAIFGATLHSSNRSAAIENATVVIAQGKFAAVGAGLAPPAGARVIDAAGAIVTSGLMNAGAHLGLVEISEVADTRDESDVKAATGGDFDVQYAFNPNSTLLPIARGDGLTRALAIPGRPLKSPFAGVAAVLRLTAGADILDRPKAAFFFAVGGSGLEPPAGSRAVWLGLLRKRLEKVRTTRNGRDADGPNDVAPTDALARVLDGGSPLAIIAAREADIRQAIAIQRDFGVRVVLYGGAEAWRAADALAENGLAVVVNPFDALPASYDEIGARSDNAAILHRAGVRIAFWVPGIHFSHNAGSAVREAAGLAVANGLPWAEALNALTINPASLFGVADHFGDVAAGFDADLVIWDGDPFEPASRPTAVFVRGVESSLVTRQSLLAERYHPKHRQAPWPPAYR